MLVKDIVEVRCGQQTRNFQLYPYMEVGSQSFSLIFEKCRGEWCGINSLDVICDSIIAFEQWKKALESLIYGSKTFLPLRNLHSTADPFLSYLKQNWSCLTEKGIITIDAATAFIRKYSKSIKKNNIKNLFKNISQGTNSGDHMNWHCFYFILNMLKEKSPVYDYYKKYCHSFPDLGMTPPEFQHFLFKEQQMQNIDLHTVHHLILFHDKENLIYKRYIAGDDPFAYKTSSSLLSFYGFASFLRSSDNSVLIKKPQDMSHPMSHYFINSSHNTYLTGHQLKGLSSCEAYVYALHKGCRSLEIDVWDGTDGPVVTHGMTLTSKIPLRHVLEVIKVYAFDKSPYPVILSLENHCSKDQQRIMSGLFISIFGEMLAVDNLSYNNTLPSPEQLKYKIILKGNPKSQKKKSRVSKATRKISHMNFKSQRKSRCQSDSVVPAEIPNISSGSEIDLLKLELSDLQNEVTKNETSKNELSKNEETNSDLTDDNSEGEKIQVLLEDSVGQLIIYCRTIPFKRDDISTNCCEMHSFNENMVALLAEKHPQEMINSSNSKFLRSYPKGTRVDSSNYNPMLMWALGIQMVAMNMQKPDFGFHINNGFFKKSDTGYVLKPDYLLKEGYLQSKVALCQSIDINILCGQFVNKEDFLGLSILLEIEVVGIENDSSTFATEPCEDVLNPCWKNNQSSFSISVPTMSVIFFKIYAVSRVYKLIYQNCLPVDCLKPGLRYISMATPTDVWREENGIFVYIDLSNQIASPKLLKSQQNKERKKSTRQRILTM